MTPFEDFLKQHDEESWSATLTTLLRSIHEVDRNATQIWFSFYPLSLFQALERSDDRETLEQRLLMQGKFYLKDQIDSSHTFLYGHRYWPEVKSAVQKHARAFSATDSRSLTDQILAVAGQLKADVALVIGITAVAFMTIRQAGLAAFSISTVTRIVACTAPSLVRSAATSSPRPRMRLPTFTALGKRTLSVP